MIKLTNILKEIKIKNVNVPSDITFKITNVDDTYSEIKLLIPSEDVEFDGIMHFDGEIRFYHELDYNYIHDDDDDGDGAYTDSDVENIEWYNKISAYLTSRDIETDLDEDRDGGTVSLVLSIMLEDIPQHMIEK